MKISILGPPGAGKGTISKIISKKHNLKIIGAGDLLRKEVEKNTEKGKLIKEKIDKGYLAPNEITDQLIRQEIEANPNHILEGYPRHFDQLKYLEKYSSPDLVLKIKVDKKLTTERLTTRTQCTKCKEIYNTKTRPTKKKDTCDLCQAPTQKRADDTEPERIEKRHQNYQIETKPVEDYYLNEGKLEEIDGNYNYDKIDIIIKQCENKINQKEQEIKQGE